MTFTDNDGFPESLDSDHHIAGGGQEHCGHGQADHQWRAAHGSDPGGGHLRHQADQNGLPDTFAYQWFRSDGTDETPIEGAMERTYTLVSQDGGQQIKVRVTFTDGNGFSESRDSVLTAVINHSATGRAGHHGEAWWWARR